MTNTGNIQYPVHLIYIIFNYHNNNNNLYYNMSNNARNILNKQETQFNVGIIVVNMFSWHDAKNY